MTITVPEPILAIANCLATAPAVVAIALVGSRVQGAAAPSSDYDVFVYVDGELDELRQQVAAECAEPSAWRSVREDAFGDGDIWQLKGRDEWIDLMYWTTGWGEGQLRRMLVDHVASMGYSTAFWRSIRDANPLYERDDWHARLKRTASQPYPDELRRNIVRINYPYLREHAFSYRAQAAKAIERCDAVSVNHRVAAWLASYFDIVFAINRVLHPGEKRLLDFVTRECGILPDGMVTAVQLLRASSDAAPSTLEAMDDLTDNLEVVLRQEGLT